MVLVKEAYYIIFFSNTLYSDYMGHASFVYLTQHLLLVWTKMSVNWCANGVMFKWTDLEQGPPSTFYTSAEQIATENRPDSDTAPEDSFVTDETSETSTAETNNQSLVNAAQLIDDWKVHYERYGTIPGIDADVTLGMVI